MQPNLKELKQFLFFSSNKEWRGGGGKPSFLQRDPVLSGISCAETGTAKCSFQGWDLWAVGSLGGCQPVLAELARCGVRGGECASRASAGSSGTHLPAATLSWGCLVPMATACQLGRAASHCLHSIPLGCLSLFQLFQGLCADTLRANSTAAFSHLTSLPGLCLGEAD